MPNPQNCVESPKRFRTSVIRTDRSMTSDLRYPVVPFHWRPSGKECARDRNRSDHE